MSVALALVIGAITALASVPVVPVVEEGVVVPVNAEEAVASIAGSLLLHPLNTNSATVALIKAAFFIIRSPHVISDMALW